MIASSLFHFTTKISTLKLILSEKRLRASYNIEFIGDMYPEQQYAAIPMVCFCDIPLKFIIKNHTHRYGHIGLGFKKDWGLRNKVNPIMYRVKESPIEKPFMDLIRETNLNLNRASKNYSSVFEKKTMDTSIIDSLDSILGNAMKITSFIKPYEDKRNNYLDREWRWLALGEITFSPEDNERYRKILNGSYYLNPDYLDFEIDDLNYLIVERRADISQAIKVIKSLELKEMEKDILIQKIIDIESINLDM